MRPASARRSGNTGCQQKYAARKSQPSTPTRHVNRTELGGVATIGYEMDCSNHNFCDMISSPICETEECCRKQRRERGCTHAVATIPDRHQTLGKPGQPNPVSPSQYPAVRENVLVTCLKDYRTHKLSL